VRRPSRRTVLCALALLLVAAACALLVTTGSDQDKSRQAAAATAAADSNSGSDSAVELPQTTVVTEPGVSPVEPVRVVIPSIGVDAASAPKDTEVQYDRFKAANVFAFGVPDDPMATTWWSQVRPGERGTNGELPVILGHSVVGGDGVFNDLGRLPDGAEVTLWGAHGESMTFRVLSHQSDIPKDDPDALSNAFRSAPAATGLVLVTCSGGYNVQNQGSEHNTIVFAELVPALG
jgi:Sortase domain